MYHYQECGLRNVWLVNGYEEHDTPYGPGISIHDVDGLHRAIAFGLMNNVGKLSGSEMRFLRKEMGLSQAKLAELIGNDAQTVAIWEKRSAQPKIADRFIRALYREFAQGNAKIREMIEHLIDTDIDDGNERMTMEQDTGGWKVAA